MWRFPLASSGSHHNFFGPQFTNNSLGLLAEISPDKVRVTRHDPNSQSPKFIRQVVVAIPDDFLRLSNMIVVTQCRSRCVHGQIIPSQKPHRKGGESVDYISVCYSVTYPNTTEAVGFRKRPEYDNIISFLCYLNEVAVAGITNELDIDFINGDQYM